MAQLLTFSRRQPLQTVPSDLNVIVVARGQPVGQHASGRSIRIQTDLGAGSLGGDGRSSKPDRGCDC